MIQNLAGVLFVRNGHSLDYCFEAAIKSMQSVCHTVIVTYCESNDGTLETLMSMENIHLLKCDEELWQSQKGREKLAYFQNLSIEYAQQQGYEYVLLVQADEVLDETSIPHIKQALALGEEAYYVSRHNMWGDKDHMLNVPQSRKPCSSVVNRLAKSCYRSVDDGEGIYTPPASLDFINKIQMWHMGFIRNNEKHIAKIKEVQGNIFLWDYDKRADLKPEFDWKDWGFTHTDLIHIHKPLPIFVKEWVENLNK